MTTDIGSVLATLILLMLIVPLPFGTDRRVRTFPWVSATMVAINCIAFLFTQHALSLLNNEDIFYDKWGLTPHTPLPLHFITYLFIHAGASHLIWNMVVLALFMPNVEDAIGGWAVLAVYLGGGVMAGLLHVAIVLLFAGDTAAAYTPLVGASGAIAGIVGIFAVRFHRINIRLFWTPAAVLDRKGGVFELPALVGLAGWLLQNLTGAIDSLFSQERGISYWAHIGGFIAGVVVAQLTDMLGQGKSEYLVRKARAAVARGGVRDTTEALRNYRLALQRRPDDLEARKAVTEYTMRFANAGPAERKTLSRELVSLIEWNMSHDRVGQAAFWHTELRSRGISVSLSAPTLLAIGRHCAGQGDKAMALDVFRQVTEMSAAKPDLEAAYLEAAMIQLDSPESSKDAAGTLRSFLNISRKTADTTDSIAAHQLHKQTHPPKA